MENEGLDKQSMVGSSPSMDPFEGLYSIEEETIEMQSNLLVDNTMVESQVAVMNNVHLVEPKCHEEGYASTHGSDTGLQALYDYIESFTMDSVFSTEEEMREWIISTSKENGLVVIVWVGVTSTEMTFSVAFAFMDGEKEDNYMWVLEKLKGMMDPDSLPEVVVIDRELALLNAIARVFLKATHLLCRWHIEKNVFAKCRRKFDDKT
ncbi:hypothetical protein Vadar_005828 [Vaccinium darrowii]|uniref:Uncharacterized protein n=1 Tax=Vaccinium darrowii TaxID=229202 RepID=A0ACB7Z2N4_9ERIC|nr:hypothetical protein Vadar_005828 [Vaccinium darrowii]